MPFFPPQFVALLLRHGEQRAGLWCDRQDYLGCNALVVTKSQPHLLALGITIYPPKSVRRWINLPWLPQFFPYFIRRQSSQLVALLLRHGRHAKTRPATNQKHRSHE